MHLNVKLRDGFEGDTVTLLIDGRVVYERSGVQTNLAISHADTLDLEPRRSSVRLRVEVAGYEPREATIAVEQTPFADVRLVDGTIMIQPSAEEIPLL